MANLKRARREGQTFETSALWTFTSYQQILEQLISKIYNCELKFQINTLTVQKWNFACCADEITVEIGITKL